MANVRAWKRIAIVTLAVSALGVLCGALLGPVAIGLGALRAPGTTPREEWPDLLLAGALGGALFGAVLAPIVAWLLLRRVPLARAILGTAGGILIGLAAGAVAQPRFIGWYGLGGFVLAAAWLHWTARRSRGAERQEGS